MSKESKESVLVYKVPVFEKEADRILHVKSLLNSLIEDTKKDNTLMNQCVFRDRELVEDDINYVQINRQVLLYKEINGQVFIFTNRKIAKSSEQRLLGRLNIFIGGHCNLADIHNETDTVLDFLAHNRDRELQEEVVMNMPLSACTHITTQSLYVMDEPVSCHHACIYDVYNLPTECEVSILETDKLEGKFYTIEELLNDERLDNWSISTLKDLISRKIL